MKYQIDKMTAEDWPQVCSIYLEGIAGGHSTFEASAPDWRQWDAAHMSAGRLVARTDSAILGWAALRPVSSRHVYAGVAEISLYVGTPYQHQGVGSALLCALVDASEKAGIWTVQGGIFPENTASLGLVKKYGFREVGRREKLGKMTYGGLAGTWRDVILVERRSKLVGLE